MRALNLMLLTLCALLATACVKEHRIVLTLPDAATCAALCVESLQVAITVDGSPVTEESYACNDTLAFDAPAEGSTVTIEVTGVDATGAAVASARSSGRFGNVQRPRLQALTAAACGTPVDAQVDLGSEDLGVEDLGVEDLGVADQGVEDRGIADQGDQDAADATTGEDAAPVDRPGTIAAAPLDDDEAIFVSAMQGNDADPGTMQQPVKTFGHAHRLAVEQRKVIVLSHGEYRATEPLQISIYGNHEFRDGVWRLLPYEPLQLKTIIRSDGGAVLSIADDVVIDGLTVYGQADDCPVVLLDDHRVQMHWVAVFGRSELRQSPVPPCALHQTNGQIHGEFISLQDAYLSELAGQLLEPAPATVRIEGGRFQAVNIILHTQFHWAPTLEVHTGARVDLHGALMVGGFGVAIHGGAASIAQASFDVLHAALLLPDDNADSSVTVVNALVKTETPLSGVVGIFDSFRTQMTLQAVMKNSNPSPKSA